MFDLEVVPSGLLEPLTTVVGAIQHKHRSLAAGDLMVVGAQCRDILHAAQGHQFVTAATHDLDLALALPSREDYSELVAGFRISGNSGIRYDIAGVLVDLLPFGGIEDPVGVAAPIERGEPLSVWGVFRGARERHRPPVIRVASGPPSDARRIRGHEARCMARPPRTARRG